MSTIIYEDEDRRVEVSANGYEIITADGRRLGMSRYVGEIRPLPPIMRKAVKASGKTGYVFLAGLAMPRQVATAIKAHSDESLEADRRAYETSHPGAKERGEIERLFDRSRSEKLKDEDYSESIRLRLEAEDRLDVWRKKYPAEAGEEDAENLRARAAKKRELAARALLYDADGSLSPADQERRSAAFRAEAEELDKLAAAAAKGE